ncbi:hypothetical protein DFH05DRAFT_528856 [Lentinula detonsa]|uniref:UBZ4-type domain-containing protein n=1 Tax=Lentinula detonsa TaxID=2804962 RepID=A0A9W8NQW1_9AGAR|nr:hypothetical protein DFH05DRAFT_528856 [Lentinula detonsa]
MIQRPRNRQGRKNRADQNNGKHTRGDGRQRGRDSNSNGSSHRSLLLPTVRQVVSGAHVSIVLKIDQPTGLQVQGTVAEVLTSGDHPRGIKVRLVDGRVGRVQRMITEAEARTYSAGLTNLGRNGEPCAHYTAHEESGTNTTAVGFNLGDFFPHDPSPTPEEDSERTDSLCGKSPSKSAIQICPVCYEFEGDEIAVSHHVNSHFA